MEKTEETNSIHLVSSQALPCCWPLNGVAALVGITEKMGIDPPTILDGSGIHPQDLSEPEVFITPEQVLLVLRRIPTQADDPSIGLMIGHQYHIVAYGKLGAAAMSSDTFLDAIRLVFNYLSLVTNYFQFDLSKKGNLVFLKMKELIDLKDVHVLACEIEFVSIHRMASDVLGIPLVVSEIRLDYPRPEYASAYQEVFHCPVHFNAPENMMVFDGSFLSKQLPMSNPVARTTYEKECEQLYLRQAAHKTVTGQVRNKIIFQSEGLPSFSRLAQSMNISVSTLRRRLAKEGTSYRNLTAEILREKAIEMIRTTSYPIMQIAMELGYNDLANFYRAFKGWTGHTPGYYRKRNR